MRFSEARHIASIGIWPGRGIASGVPNDAAGFSGESSQQPDGSRKASTGALWAVFAGLLLLCFADAGTRAEAQTIPVGDLREEQLRLQQLLNDSLSTSFVHRPVWNRVYEAYMDAAEGTPGWWNRKLTNPEYELVYGFTAGIYEPVFRATTNSDLPFGENNAAAWYGKGFNTELFGGFYLRSEYVTFSFRPQVTWQQNNDFVTPRFVPRDEDGEIRYVAEAIGHRIDAPFRFGPDSFWTSNRGHSSIRLHYDIYEVGFSTEPLWWGGAEKYPLMMSNNAPGVKHLFIGTRAPLEIPYVGGLEMRWMGGWPEDSDYFDQDEEFQKNRFMNAINVSLSPELVPNLHIGLTRTYHFYIEEGGLTRDDFFVIFDPFQRVRMLEKRGDDRKSRNQLASVYGRWVWPEQHLEIFGEFFRETHSWDWRDFMTQPMHDSGYSYGFQKLVRSVPKIDFLKVHFEFTQMTPSRIEEVRSQTYYYTHHHVRQGHTNQGQVLGAAIGPGSSSYYVAMDAYRNNMRAGLFLQRWVDNEHFHYVYNQPRATRFFGDKWRHPVRVNLGSRFLYGPGPWYLSGEVSWTKAYNYGRFGYGQYGIEWEDRVMDDMTNLQIQLSFRYVF